MVHEFKLQRRVEFSDTDMAGIVHFSNFFRYMEATEHAFFRSLGITLHANEDGRMIGWARVHASCDYVRPAHYQELLEVHLRVLEKNENSLTYGFVFQRVDEGSGEERTPARRREIARGKLKVVCVSKNPGDARMRASAMPPEVSRLVEVAPQTT